MVYLAERRGVEPSKTIDGAAENRVQRGQALDAPDDHDNSNKWWQARQNVAKPESPTRVWTGGKERVMVVVVVVVVVGGGGRQCARTLRHHALPNPPGRLVGVHVRDNSHV